MSRELTRELWAEFLGTLVLITFGVAVVAQVVLGGGQTGEYLSINFGWGLGVTMGIYVAGGITGAHLNPAVTLAFAFHRGFPWKKVLPYCFAQFAGAFVASAIVFATYHQALDEYDHGIRSAVGEKATAGIWATYPRQLPSGKFVSTHPTGLMDQIVGTALLVGIIFAISDRRNLPPQANLAPLIVGALVFLIGMTFGYNGGYAINPARDIGPRLFTYLAGWGSQVFTAGNYWWWVPIVGPLLGAILGGYVYDFCIGKRHPPEVNVP